MSFKLGSDWNKCKESTCKFSGPIEGDCTDNFSMTLLESYNVNQVNKTPIAVFITDLLPPVNSS